MKKTFPVRRHSQAHPRWGKKVPPAVIMSYSKVALSAAWALGRKGIEVIVVGSREVLRPAIARSRYITYLRGPGYEPDEAIGFYLDISRKMGLKAVLIPAGDHNFFLLSRYGDVLSERYHYFLPAMDIMMNLASKKDFAALAKKHELPVPPTWIIDSRAQLDTVIMQLPFPCVVKPEYITHWSGERAERSGLIHAKALLVNNPAELSQLYKRLFHVNPRIIIQKMIIGPDSNNFDVHMFVDPHGEIKAEFVARKIRMVPAHFGMGSYIESVCYGKILETARDVLRKINYRGLANMDFKRDEGDGKLYLLEINPRLGLTTGLPLICGINFPHYYYQTCIQGDYAVPAGYPAGKKWIDPIEDFKSMGAYVKDGTWTWTQWTKSVLKGASNVMFAWDDPLPWIYEIARIIKKSATLTFRILVPK